MLWFILSGKFRKQSFWFNNRRLSHPRNQSEMEVMCLRIAKLWPQKLKSTNKGTFIGANCMFDVLMRLLWGKIVYKTMNGFTQFISGIRDDFVSAWKQCELLLMASSQLMHIWDFLLPLKQLDEEQGEKYDAWERKISFDEVRWEVHSWGERLMKNTRKQTWEEP